MVYFQQTCLPKASGTAKSYSTLRSLLHCRVAEGDCMEIYLFKRDEATLGLQFEV